ncbi:MAG: DNA primase [Bacteriovoracaceae bacterium]|nr:DNA primase [Bacteriovoracaceae bacterium]
MSWDDLKDRIKEIPITSIVENFIPLKKQGSSMVGCCPFHGDKNPSMHVSDSKGIFKCFVCESAGDSITFVQKYMNVDFRESMKEICKISGLPFESFVQEKKASPKFDTADKILNVAMKIYRKHGEKNNPEFDKFLKTRKLAPDHAKEFMLGFSPKNHSVYNYLSGLKDPNQKALALSIAKEIGMIGQNDNGDFYDKFRQRVMFPIWDQHGRMTGFSSRAVFDWQKAKYMNSSDSFMFNKSKNLFGLHRSKNMIREKGFVIVAEGHMDLIVMHQHGFINSVAIMGTAMPQSSIDILKRYSKNFYMALDSDKAGFNAMKRILPDLLKSEISAKHINYAPYKDADDLIQAEGTIEFQKRIDDARDLADVILEAEIPDTIPTPLNQKFDILKGMFEILAPLGDSLEASERLVDMARRLGLKSDSAQISGEFKKYLEAESARAARKPIRNTPQQKVSSPPHDRPQIHDAPPMDMTPPPDMDGPIYYDEEMMENTAQALEIIRITKREKNLIKTLIECPDCFTEGGFKNIIELIDNPLIKGYVNQLRDVFDDIDDNSYPGILKDIVNSEDYPLPIKEVVFLAVDNYKHVNFDQKTVKMVLKDLIKNMELNRIESAIDALVDEQKNCVTQEQLNVLGTKKIQLKRDLVKKISQK